MTTGIIHGDPGSYKTATLVNDYLVPAIKQGRVVVTNIRGVKSAEEIAEIYGFELPDESEIILVSFDQEGFDRMAKFFHWVPQGALILMDEGQRIYPTRLRDFSMHDLRNPEDEIRPRTVEDSFDSHRHMNWDIYISTPNIGKVHKEIRAVAEFGYRHKNLATVFSFLKGRYKRVVHNAENSGNAMGHTISSSMRKIDKRCFDVYQSTATGKTKDAGSSVSFLKQPKVLLVLGIVFYSLYNLGSTLLWGDGLPRMFGGSAKTSVNPAGVNVAVDSGKTFSGVSGGTVSKRFVSTVVPGMTPLSGSSLYHVGSINDDDLFQAEYSEEKIISLTGSELKALGFSISYRSSAFVQLVYNDIQIFVFSRPSRNQPFNDPAVIRDPAGGVIF